ncbi:hypothetical protein IV203_033095 [Nitzschia inconspicua]|uniref:Uncharacterized protein n=1 Tax=Nitzschia inconspicua TaxID=303405 RepID=A0A9K3KLZ2_9STRA|nr:hypothetical protein IV203_033095 [Nitzschia inconspicua]
MKQPSEHQLDENSDEIPEMRKGDDSTNRQDAIQNNPCDSDVTTHVGDDDENDADLHDNGLVRYRCVRSVVDSWPRTTAVVCRIILPLWLLIGITLGFGHLLGQYEEQNEYYQNDEIAKERFLLQQLPINKTLEAIYNMPEACIDTYTDFKDEDNNSTNSEGFLAAYVQHNKLKIVFPNVTPGLADLSVAETLQEVREFMSICSAISTFLGGDCFDYIRTEVTANVFEEMTFTGFDVGTPPCMAE